MIALAPCSASVHCISILMAACKFLIEIKKPLTFRTGLSCSGGRATRLLLFSYSSTIYSVFLIRGRCRGRKYVARQDSNPWYSGVIGAN